MERIHLSLVGDDADDQTPVDDGENGASIDKITEAIRSGTCPRDRHFDRFLPDDLRRVSSQYWTPLAVTLRVAGWLDGAGVRSVVDVGSGAGKFCVAAAIASRCSYTGIEQRPRLVQAAGALARLFSVDDRVQFVHRALGRGSLPTADAYYLYNPFGENLFEPDEHLGTDVELSPERYKQDIALMEEFFDRVPVGTYVVKYNGFGGQMPSSYEQVHVDRDLPNLLRMWRKCRETIGATPRDGKP